MNAPFSTAFRAGLLNDLSRAAARVTGAHGSKRTKRSVLLHAYLTAAAAGSTLCRLRSRLGASAAAGLANLFTRDQNLLARSERGLLKRNGEVIFQIVARYGPVPVGRSPESAESAEHRTENV